MYVHFLYPTYFVIGTSLLLLQPHRVHKIARCWYSSGPFLHSSTSKPHSRPPSPSSFVIYLLTVQARVAFPFGLDSSRDGRILVFRNFPTTELYCLTRSQEAIASVLILRSTAWLMCVSPALNRELSGTSTAESHERDLETDVGDKKKRNRFRPAKRLFGAHTDSSTYEMGRHMWGTTSNQYTPRCTAFGRCPRYRTYPGEAPTPVGK